MPQLVKNLPAMRETWLRILGWEDLLEKGTATPSSILAWRIPWDHCSFLLGSGVHKILFVPSKSLCPPVLWKFCNQIPLGFKVKFPGGSQSLCQIPRLGNLLWALELLQQCENFFDVIVLQFVGHLLSRCMVGLLETSSKRIYLSTCRASQVCCSQSPCPCGRRLLTCASTETLKHSKAGLSQSVNEPDNRSGVVTHVEPDILVYEVKPKHHYEQS